MAHTGQHTGFLGLSHLGLVASVGWASFGESVVGVDPDREIVDLLTRSRLPILEPGLEGLLNTHHTALTWSTDPSLLAACPLVFVSRDVPTNDDNTSDLSVVERLVETVIPHLGPDATLVIMSQVPPGFTRSMAARVRRQRPDAVHRVYYWVETLVLGRALERFLRPERIILGCEDPDAALPVALDTGLRRFTCPILPMRYESAELTKTAINLYLASSVTYANTLADLCERIGADWSEVSPALRLDARIGQAAYLSPSLGIGGGNLERDLITIWRQADHVGIDGTFVKTIIDYNTRRSGWVLRKLQELVFTEVTTPVIAVWGLAYKKNTRSLKNSSSIRVLTDLQGRAQLRAYDPVVHPSSADLGLPLACNRDEVLEGADCLLIMTDWDEFASVDGAKLQRAMRRPIVIDCVGALHRCRHELNGVRYVAMGLGDAA
jgi:UDPglucose 6-dehydrogenase